MHLYARKNCDDDCLVARQMLQELGRDFRQYWYDRRRGIPARRNYKPRDTRPLWNVWRAA